MRSGQFLTPFNELMAFVGVPTGFILAKTERYKWVYYLGCGLLTAVLFGVVFFKAGTPVICGALASTPAGLGSGGIPNVNTLMVPYAIFEGLLGVAIALAISGSVLNVAYAKTLDAALSAALHQSGDKATRTSPGDPRVLLSPSAMKALKKTLHKAGTGGKEFFKQTVEAIRASTRPD
jgi:uncharacterized membrane protein YccC